jgi:chromosome segregation ATPase
MWKWIIGGILALFAIGGTAYGYDQHQKRRREQEEYRRELARKEAQLREMEARLGRHHEQVRALAAEVERLRRAAA